MSDQPSLFDTPPCPYTPPGAYLSPSGADLKGPLLACCEGCHMPITFNPGLYCPTPAVHTWTDPGAGSPDDDEEEIMDEQSFREHIANQVDMAIAMQGDEVDGAAARAVCLELLAEPEWRGAYPMGREKAGEQAEFIQKLALEVLTRIGSAPAEQQIDRIPDAGKWDAGDGEPARPRPIDHT